MTRTLYSPALDAASALLFGQEVVDVLSLPESQNGVKQRKMIGQRAVVRKRRGDEWLLVQYGATTAWVRPTDVEPVVIP